MQPLAIVSSAMLTPFGDGSETFAALLAGRTAFAPHDCPWPLRNRAVAYLPGHPMGEAELGKWQRSIAVRTAKAALAGIPSSNEFDPVRSTWIFATSFGHLLDEPGEETMSSWAHDCMDQLGIRQAPLVVGSGCSSGADAIGLAAAMIDGGATDAAVVVAADVISPGKRLAHSLLGTMTPGQARPFDCNRNGMLLGEAAGAIVLQRHGSCTSRQGELIGVGAANDAYGLTAPDPSGLSVRLAIERALRTASIERSELALYLAHATGTELNDVLEAEVLSEMFAEQPQLAVAGAKGAIGHSLGACGLIEFLLLLEALRKRVAPPIAGLEAPIGDLADRVATLGGRRLSGPVGISVKLGFGGFNSALIARAS